MKQRLHGNLYYNEADEYDTDTEEEETLTTCQFITGLIHHIMESVYKTSTIYEED